MSSVQLEVGEDEEFNTESSLCSMDRQNVPALFIHGPHYTCSHTYAQHTRPRVAQVRAYPFCPHLSVFLAIEI